MSTAALGPAPSAELLTPDELVTVVRKSAGRLRRHLNDGSLHGHRDRDIPKARWSVPRAVALAWKAGRSIQDQQAVCPLCPTAPVTPLSRKQR